MLLCVLFEEIYSWDWKDRKYSINKRAVDIMCCNPYCSLKTPWTKLEIEGGKTDLLIEGVSRRVQGRPFKRLMRYCI